MKYDSITLARQAIEQAIKNNPELWNNDSAARRASGYTGIRELAIDPLAVPEDVDYSFPRLLIVSEFTNTANVSGDIYIDGYIISIILQHLYVEGGVDEQEAKHMEMLNKIISTIPAEFRCSTGLKHFYGIVGSMKVEMTNFEVEM